MEFKPKISGNLREMDNMIFSVNERMNLLEAVKPAAEISEVSK